MDTKGKGEGVNATTQYSHSLIKQNIMTDSKTTRTPRDPKAIINGLMKLPLRDRVAIKKELQASIDYEVKELGERAKEAAAIANGTQPGLAT